MCPAGNQCSQHKGNRLGCVASGGGGAKCAWILLTGQGHDGSSQGNTAAPERTGEHTRTEAKTRDVSYESSRGEIRSMGRLEDTIGQVGKDCQAGRSEGIIHHRERLYPTIVRGSTQAGHQREETIYGLTSLSRKRAPALQLLAYVQAHWLVENRLHWRRDVTLGEDRCQVRRQVAPPALAALNGVVLALMDWLHVPNVASKMRWFDAYPQHALRLLCLSLQR